MEYVGVWAYLKGEGSEFSELLTELLMMSSSHQVINVMKLKTT